MDIMRLDFAPSLVHNRHDWSIAPSDMNGPTIAIIPSLRNRSDLCARSCHFINHLDRCGFPVEEVDRPSPSNDGAMSGSDAERLDCASASDERSLLGGGDGDAWLDDDDDADLLLRIAPDAHWNPLAADGDEATCTCQAEWPEWEAGLPAGATGNHHCEARREDGFDGCDDAGVVCTLSAGNDD